MPYYYDVPRYCGIYYVLPVVGIPTWQNVPKPSWLPQVSLSVEATLRDTSSSAILTQTFVNPSKTDPIEKAKYTFPLYESCAVVAFQCLVGKRLIKGVIKEKEEAKVEYDQAVSRGETAGLLEMQTPDVFSTSIGNIPAGETVRVHIEYIMELKHDAEVDGLRFTIPTSIAPRYGDAPSGVGVYFGGKPIPGALEKGGMKILVKLTMPSNVRSVQSPSHTISMHLGGHVENVPDDSFNPKHALATLSQSSTELGTDFVLLVKCAELSSPRALLETHPRIPNSKALMVTLVPKFNLPSGPKPEIVFVVDRSGSMSHRMQPLKLALAVFLKSLPIGVKFNICSFGSSHTFLWNKSQPYSAATLEEAQRHVEDMSANYGGTEILPPVKAAISSRYADIPLEVMVLTDGEVWNTEELFQYIRKETASGDVRVFSLGIGRDVSHALVEGMSRVGGGFTQIVLDEKEGLEGKVVRMLKGGLSPHIKDYRLDWDGKPTDEEAKGTIPKAETRAKTKILLFDSTVDTDAPISKTTNAANRFDHLPKCLVPTVIQAPYAIPSLFPFSRSTVYVILSGDVPPPKSVWLRGTTPSGDELELEIAVQNIPEKSQTIHQLAARKLLQELEEGTSYLHSGKYGVDREKNPGTFTEWVDREGIRVGVTYGVASRWTSFVAVEKKTPVEVKPAENVDSDSDIEIITLVDDADFEVIENEEKERAGAPSGAARTMDNLRRSKITRAPPPPPPPVSFGADSPSHRFFQQTASPSPQSSFGQAVPSFSPRGRASYAAFGSAPASDLVGWGTVTAQSAPIPMFGGGSNVESAVSSSPKKKKAASGGFGRLAAYEPSLPLPKAAPPLPVPGAIPISPTSTGYSGTAVPSAPAATAPATARDRTNMLIAQQTFEGSFLHTPSLAQIMGTTMSFLQAKLDELSPIGIKLEEEGRAKLWATLLAIGLFEGKLKGEMEMWELVVEKAKAWISGLPDTVKEDVKKMEGAASKVLSGLKLTS